MPPLAMDMPPALIASSAAVARCDDDRVVLFAPR